MRMVLVLASIVLVATVLAVAGVRYVTSVPGASHTGGLPALAESETVTAPRAFARTSGQSPAALTMSSTMTNSKRLRVTSKPS